MEINGLDLSIIIVSWNTKEYLKGCLKSVEKEKKELSCEVFVVDNASSDGSPEMVKKEFPQVILHANENNVGFARANNQAIQGCRGRYILLLNPDTVVLDSCLKKMFEFMEKHPDVGASGGRILNPEGKVDLFRSAKRFPTPLSKFYVDVHLDKIFPWIRFFGKYAIAGWKRDDVREVDVLSGAFMFVRSETIQDVGLLDESFFLLAEDLDWCRRIKQKNWKISFNPEAQIIHYGGKSIDQIKLTRLKNEIHSHSLYFQKHHRGFAVFQYRVLTGFANFLKTIYWIIRYIFGKNRKQASINLKAHFHSILYCFQFRTGSFGQ